MYENFAGTGGYTSIGRVELEKSALESEARVSGGVFALVLENL